MRQALLAGTILSIVAGLTGYFVVLRHQAFAGESLSDVAFTGALGGAALGINPFLSLIGTTVVVALAMGGLGERLRGRDVAIGTVLAWVLGLGVLFLSLFTAHTSGTGTGFSGVTVLFGNILGTSPEQVRSIAITSGLTILVLLLIARPLFFASLDPDVAAARGVPVRSLGLGFMVLLAITISATRIRAPPLARRHRLPNHQPPLRGPRALRRPRGPLHLARHRPRLLHRLPQQRLHQPISLRELRRDCGWGQRKG